MPNTTTRAHPEEPSNSFMQEQAEHLEPNSPDVAPGPSSLPVYGSEVVGRRIKLLHMHHSSGSPTKSAWQSATITAFNAAELTHEVTFPSAGGADKQVQWLLLPHHKFKWQDTPAAGAPPNPSWEASPKQEEAVGRTIKVFWPGMCRWYQGVVSAYDAGKDMHVVDYVAGDTYEHHLRHEAVQWPNGRSSTSPQQDTSGPTQRNSNASASSAFAATTTTTTSTKGREGTAPLPPHAPHAVHLQTARVKRSRPACSGAQAVSQLKLPSLSSRQAQAQAHPAHTPSAPSRGGAQAQGVGSGSQRAGCNPAAGSSSNVEKQRQLTLAAMLSPPANKPAPLPTYCPSAASLLLGVRLSITGSIVRSGRVIDVQPTTSKHKIRYDDGASEWLSLSSTSWQWQTPRGVSAGLNAAMLAALRKLGSSNMQLQQQQVGQYPSQGPPIPALGPTPKSADAAVGHKLWIWCRGDARWHAAQVMALSASGSGRHHVLYMDGSDEWVELNSEVVAWEPAGPATGMQHVLVGMPKGTRAPVGQAAVGWRIAVYWPQDQTLYEGVVTGYHASTWEHEVLYDDGELEVIHLEEELVVWRCRAAQQASRNNNTSSGAATSSAARGSAQQPPGPKRVRISEGEGSPGEASKPALSQSPAVSVIGEAAVVADGAGPGAQQQHDVMQQWGADASAAVRALEACKSFAGAGQVHGLPHVQSVV